MTRLALRTSLLLSLPLLAACERPEPPPSEFQTIRGQLPGYPNPDPLYAVAKVMIPGHDPVTPDASGAFEISDVKAPYDLVVYYPAVARMGAVAIFQGLHRNDPTIPANFYRTRRTDVSGTFSGPRFPLPMGRDIAVFFESPFPIDERLTFTQRTYQHHPEWSGAETVTGTLHAVEFGKDPTTGKLTYGAYGRREGVTVTDEVPLTGQDIALSPIGTASITGRVVGIPGLTLHKTSVSLELAHEPSMNLLTYYSPATNELEMAVPDLPGTTFTMEAVLTREATTERSLVQRTGLHAGMTDIVLTPPELPRMLTPDNGAQLVDLSAGFSWEGQPRSLYSVSLTSTAPDEPVYMLFTTDSHAALPDLSPLGLTVSRRGTSYSWYVAASGPTDSVDDWLRHTPTPSDTRFSSSTAMRGFTTAP